MSKFINTLVFSLILLFSAYGQQNDPRSQRILDDMTARFKTYPSVALDFSLTITNTQDQSETEQAGKIWIKGEKYKLEIPEFVIYFDGSRIFQFMPAVNEVYITKPDPDEEDEDFQLLNPQTYFNLSSQNFISDLVRETTHNNRAVNEINLYPINFSGSNFSRINMMVERSTLQLVYVRAFLKNGIHYTLNFRPYAVQQTALRDAFFVFNRSEHPNVVVIDLSF